MANPGDSPADSYTQGFKPIRNDPGSYFCTKHNIYGAL